MTNELGPASRALLGAARDGLGPDAAAIARMRSRIDVAVSAGAIAAGAATSQTSATVTSAGTATGSTTGSTAAISGGISFASKLGLAALVAIVVGTGAAVVTRDRSPTVAQIPAFEPAEAPMHSVTTAREPRVATETTGRTAGIDLAREVELVDQATLALRHGDPKAALAAVAIHASETNARGQLAEDAAAIEIEARCKLGESVAPKLSVFDSRWPSSAQRARLTAATRSCR